MSACTAGTYLPNPSQWIQSSSSFVNADAVYDTPQESMSFWWERIDDPILHDYVEAMLMDNLSIEQASERVIQAQKRANITRGAFSPSLSVDSAAGRSFTSDGGDRSYSSSYGADLNAAWEIDLFGKIRKSVEAADANFKASLYEREALSHALIAELFQRRIAIGVNHKLLALARDNADNREKIYQIVQRRYESGVRNTSAADVYLAEENYVSVKSDISRFDRMIADGIYELDVLLGQVPGTSVNDLHAFNMLPAPLDVAVCLPADLLDRRPDLRASALRIKAANADVGVAVADLYPSLNLAGSIGFDDNDLSNILSADRMVGSILGNITARIFEGGALRANIDLQKSEARELIAAYGEDVLEAMRDVESALKAEQTLNEELKNLKRGFEALEKAEDVAEERYIRGILTLTEFLDVQQRGYIAEQNYLNAQQAKWDARISLYLALGGDWLGRNPEQEQCST